jgi:hypothetical protein
MDNEAGKDWGTQAYFTVRRSVTGRNAAKQDAKYPFGAQATEAP